MLKENQIWCIVSKRDTCLFLVRLRYVCNIFIGKYDTKKTLVRSQASREYNVRMHLKEKVLEDVF